MFEITADDIRLLDDTDLRTLVGLLCEAEVKRQGFSSSSVESGGKQDAPDGGIDVHVSLPEDARIEGFVPRPVTGFQVKKRDMPPAAILAEMCPAGVLRPTIRKLAEQSGAYIIVSSTDSHSHSALQTRRAAMEKAVSGLPDARALSLDFYDGGRLASWVRDHAGLVVWLRGKIGKAMPGWRAYGSWDRSPEGVDGEYLSDHNVRFRSSKKEELEGIAALEGINQIRDHLREPGRVVRLVGLSGVGKTRLAQALFDTEAEIDRIEIEIGEESEIEFELTW